MIPRRSFSSAQTAPSTDHGSAPPETNLDKGVFEVVQLHHIYTFFFGHILEIGLLVLSYVIGILQLILEVLEFLIYFLYNLSWWNDTHMIYLHIWVRFTHQDEKIMLWTSWEPQALCRNNLKKSFLRRITSPIRTINNIYSSDSLARTWLY